MYKDCFYINFYRMCGGAAVLMPHHNIITYKKPSNMLSVLKISSNITYIKLNILFKKRYAPEAKQ